MCLCRVSARCDSAFVCLFWCVTVSACVFLFLLVWACAGVYNASGNNKTHATIKINLMKYGKTGPNFHKIFKRSVFRLTVIDEHNDNEIGLE